MPAVRRNNSLPENLTHSHDILSGKDSSLDNLWAKIKPILIHLHEATENVMQDQTLPRDQRLEKIRPQRQLADEKMRAFLSEQQRKKLDRYEQGPHAEVHGTLSGTPKPPVR